MIVALAIFILMYVGMLIKSEWRVWFALISAAMMVIIGIIPLNEVPASVNWNVLMMIAGTMGVVYFFIESKMPARMADFILLKAKNVCWAVVALALFAGMVSAFVDNVATVLMTAPVGMSICKKQKINPVPVMISIAVSSNLQGAATLVGDTTSILLGGYADMTFLDFIWWKGRPSIFFAVELGALGTAAVLLFIFRQLKQKVLVETLTEVSDFFPGIMMLLIIICLITASFFQIPYVNEYKNGLICMLICVIVVIRSCIKQKSREPIMKFAGSLDFETLGMLLGLFIVIAGITKAGIVDRIAEWFASIGDENLFLLYTLLVFSSVIFSAFIDNIPYVAAMLPVVKSISLNLGIDPTLLYFGLLSGATLGGNITPFGASANVTGIGILKKAGYEVKISDFMKIGLPFTMIAVVIGYLFNWLVWGKLNMV